MRWGITDPSDLDWMFERVTALPAATMASPIRLGRPEAMGVARSFVCGAESGSGLDPMVSHPRELSDILLQIGGTL